MSGIVFQDEKPAVEVDPGRTDIACFVGLVRYAVTQPPAGVLAWWRAQGWSEGPNARPGILPDVPVPIESWAGFTALFDPGGGPGSFGTDYLAEAVRMFFAQGGRRCYVVRTGDPVTLDDTPAIKNCKRTALLPDTSYRPDDRRSWTGVGHLGGLPDVSFLVLPDLPILHASQPSGVPGEVPQPPSGPEQFTECSPADITPKQFRLYGQPAPRLSVYDYGQWSDALRQLVAYLSNGDFREVQLVAAVPLPHDPAEALPSSVHSAFLQLVYPWLKTTGSHVLLESLEPPDGALAGILARNALMRGTFASAVKVTPAEIVDVFPILPAGESLQEHISLFGFTPSGLRLLSDVTTSSDESYRQARVNRLVSVIRRASRRLGEQVIFDNNGPDVWGRVEAFLQNLMTRLWTLNALEGAAVKDAFDVRCDRSTMTQNDIDNGRLVAEVTFAAAATIDRITVTLAVETSGASVQEIAAAQVVVA